MYKIFVTRAIPQQGIDILKDYASVKVWQDELPPARGVLLQEVKDIDGLLCLLTETIDAEVLKAAGKLKVIGNYAVGFDNIDIDEATRRGIAVVNTPGVLTETTADLAFSLLTAAARNLIPADRYVRQGQWKTWEPMLLLGRDLYRATIGIVGMGRIGQAMAKRAAGFDMNILYYSNRPVKEVEEKMGAEKVSLEKLLEISDFVSIHLPLNETTENLIGKNELSKMKAGAILINTARGPIVDEAALVEALRANVIAGAALDVFQREPINEKHPLCDLSNVVLAPHIGSGSFKTRSRMAILAAQGIAHILTGKKPKNIVNPQVL